MTATKSKRQQPARRFDPDKPLVSGDEGLANLGRMFGRVISVSNKAVQTKLKAEKRKRQAKRKTRGSK
jgi:hypothetical protein